MESGLQGAPRITLQVLLWLVGLLMATVVVLTANMEYGISRNGGGEMVDSIALCAAMILVGYYVIVLITGRAMLRKGGASWGWQMVAAMLVLVFAPIIIVLRLSF